MKSDNIQKYTILKNCDKKTTIAKVTKNNTPIDYEVRYVGCKFAANEVQVSICQFKRVIQRSESELQK